MNDVTLELIVMTETGQPMPGTVALICNPTILGDEEGPS